MESLFEAAIALRKAGKYNESRALLRPFLTHQEMAGRAHLLFAWSYDNQGKAKEAVAHYRLAIEEDLSEVDRFEALFGLASTLRSLGSYDEALTFFEQTIVLYPEAQEVQPFYAMCLYNLGRHKEATSNLLHLLVSTTDSDAIKRYQQAIRLYADDLDKSW